MIFYVASHSKWFLVFARDKRKAKSEGVREFGRGQVKEVRLATAAEIKYFTDLKGEEAMKPTLI